MTTPVPDSRSQSDGQPFDVAVQPSGSLCRDPERNGHARAEEFFASLLIRHGESVKAVQARLGHSNAAEALNTYARLWPDSDDRTRAAIDEVLGPRTVRETSEGVVNR